MKILITILLIIFLASCYTVIDRTKFNLDNTLVQITDTSVFLPDSNFLILKQPVKILYQTWIDSRESRNPSTWRLFNLEKYSVGRFRPTIIFRSTGEYRQLRLSPNDAHYYKNFRWRLFKSEPTKIALFDDDGKIKEVFRIEILEPDRLVLMKI